MDNSLGKLRVNGILKPKHKHLEEKGLTHIPHLPQKFQVKWIWYVLSWFHNGQLWLEKLVLITKKMIHRITSLPMLAKEKSAKTLAEWDGRGMKISSVSTELKFGIHVIAHKIYSSIQLNSVSCEAVDLAYKVVKKNLSYDLADLLLKQLKKNMESIRSSKNNLCKFGSLLTCFFFYVQKFFPSKGTFVWRKDTTF